MIDEIINAWKKEDLLKQSLTIINEMFDTTHNMFIAAKCEYENGKECINKELVYNKDKKVNHMQIEVRRKILEHLSFSDAQDISTSLIFLYTVNYLERIGDYCKNMEDEALVHKHHASAKNMGYDKRIREVAERVKLQFPKTKNAFLKNDSKKAQEVVEEYNEIKNTIDRIITDLEKESGMNSGLAITNALYVRHIRRVAANLKNTASSVANPFDRIGYKALGKSKTK